MPADPIPFFLHGTFSDTGLGYAYAGNESSPDTRGVAEHWRLLVAALEQAKVGERRRLPDLLGLINYQVSPMFVRGCLDLVGDAGDKLALTALASYILDTPDDEFRADACRAAMFAGVLWLVPYMAAAWVRCADRRSRDLICSFISAVLEPEPDRFIPDDLDIPAETYRQAVDERVAELAATCGGDTTPVWAGQRFGVVALASNMLARVKDTTNEDFYLEHARFLRLRHKFQAATGIDCREFFRDRELQPLAAANVLEEFLESPQVAEYEDGARYFFGRRIRD